MQSRKLSAMDAVTTSLILLAVLASGLWLLAPRALSKTHPSDPRAAFGAQTFDSHVWHTQARYLSGNQTQAPPLDREVVRASGRQHGSLQRDDAISDQRDEVLVEGLHAVVRPFTDELGNSPRLLGVSGRVSDAPGVHQDLHS